MLNSKPFQFPEDLPKPDVNESPLTDVGFDDSGYDREVAARHSLSGPLGQRLEPDYLTVTPAEQAHRDEQADAYRANCGGLSDSPDDGGAKGVLSSPMRL